MKKTALSISITLLLCGTLVWVATIGADTALSIKNKGFVSVKGFARQKITSNLGIFGVSILNKNADLQLAYDKLARDREMVQDFLSRYEFTAEETGISPVEVSEKYKVTDRGYNTHEFVAYSVAQNFRVKSANVKRIEEMAAEVGELMSQGVEILVEEPQYLYRGLESLKIDMIGLATANAKERAETLSRSGRFRLGKIADVRVGIFQITPAYSTEVSGYGINDTRSIEKEIKSVVDVKYFVR